jgi:hypothetical protein
MIKSTEFVSECIVCTEKISIYIESNDDSSDIGDIKKRMLGDFEVKCSKCNKIK